ncbi:ethionine resistance protein [Coemansia thaxteri]|nr:ethionine resistance protein [Coemansia thaxteri]
MTPSVTVAAQRVDSQETLRGDSVDYCSEHLCLLGASGSAATIHAVQNNDGFFLQPGLKHAKKRSYREVASEELCWLASSSVPIVATYFLQFSLGFANFVAIGSLGAKELAATSLAYMVSGVFALAPALGFASAMDTFCSSAYTASSDKTLVGLHFQRGAYIIVPSFNFVALPLGIYLAYGAPHMQVAGLWWGTCVGTVISAVAQLFVIIYRTDWDHEVQRCLDRLIASGPATINNTTSTTDSFCPILNSALTMDTYGSVA